MYILQVSVTFSHLVLPCNINTRGPGGLALAQFAKPFFDTVVLGDEFVEPERHTF